MTDIENYVFQQAGVETLSNQVLNHYIVIYKGEEVCSIVEFLRNSKIISALATGKNIESVGRNKEEALRKLLHGTQANIIEEEIAPGITKRTILNDDRSNSIKDAVYCFIFIVGLMLLFTGQLGSLVILGVLTWLFATNNP